MKYQKMCLKFGVGYKYDMFKINAATGSNEADYFSKHHAKKIFGIG